MSTYGPGDAETWPHYLGQNDPRADDMQPDDDPAEQLQESINEIAGCLDIAEQLLSAGNLRAANDMLRSIARWLPK